VTRDIIIIIIIAEGFVYNAIKILVWKGHQDLKGVANGATNNADLESCWTTPNGKFLG
jgi:hypothetical protein